MNKDKMSLRIPVPGSRSFSGGVPFGFPSGGVAVGADHWDQVDALCRDFLKLEALLKDDATVYVNDKLLVNEKLIPGGVPGRLATTGIARMKEAQIPFRFVAMQPKKMEISDAFLKHVASTDEIFKNFYSLHCAVSQLDIDLVKCLLEYRGDQGKYRANVNEVNEYGQTVLHKAIFFGN